MKYSNCFVFEFSLQKPQNERRGENSNKLCEKTESAFDGFVVPLRLFLRIICAALAENNLSR
jgi:hypothetical protein